MAVTKGNELLKYNPRYTACTRRMRNESSIIQDSFLPESISSGLPPTYPAQEQRPLLHNVCQTCSRQLDFDSRNAVNLQVSQLRMIPTASDVSRSVITDEDTCNDLISDDQVTIDGSSSVPLDDQATMDGCSSVPLGDLATMDGSSSVPLDDQATMDGCSSVPLGDLATMDGSSSVSLDDQATVDGCSSVPENYQHQSSLSLHLSECLNVDDLDESSLPASLQSSRYHDTNLPPILLSLNEGKRDLPLQSAAAIVQIK